MSTTWKVVDAIEVIDMLHRSLEGACSIADETVGQAKVLWQQNRQSDAFDLLITFVENHSSTLSQQLPVLTRLKELLESIGNHIEAQDRRLVALEEQMKEQRATINGLMQERDKAVAGRERQQQKVLLGQLAYKLSGLVESFVYGSGGSGSLVPRSLKQMQNSEDELTEAQKKRWLAVQDLVSSVMPFKELVDVDKYLRKLRFESAHGSDAQAQKTTLQMLETWAGVHCITEAVLPVRKYAQLLNKFSDGNRPLAPNKSAKDVFVSLG
jgi:hypothetical protein